MLQTREFVNNKQPIYKIGRTQQPLLKRFNQYTKGSVLIIHINVKDSVISEKEIISVFTKQFTCKKDLGREYFEGDISKMKKSLFEICCREDETPDENVQGCKSSIIPECADTHTSDYLGDEDVVKAFVDTWCIRTVNKKDRVSSKTLFEAFRSSEFYRPIISKNNFPAHLFRINLQKMRISGVWYWTHLRLNPPVEECADTHTSDYLGDGDVVKTFVDTLCTRTANKKDRVSSKDLFEAFQSSEFYRSIISKNNFPTHLFRINLQKMRISGVWYWTHLRLNPPVEECAGTHTSDYLGDEGVVKTFVDTLCTRTVNKKDRVSSKDLFEAFQSSEFYRPIISKNNFQAHLFRINLQNIQISGVWYSTHLQLPPPQTHFILVHLNHRMR